MTTRLRMAAVGLSVVVVLSLGIPVVAGTAISDVTTDSVSTVGHVCDQWGWHNNWGTHQHGDHWTDHPHYGDDSHHGPYGTHHDSPGPTHGHGHMQ